jgi:hypothetical protein
MVGGPVLFLCGLLTAVSGFASANVFQGVCGCVMAAAGVVLATAGFYTQAALRRAAAQ